MEITKANKEVVFSIRIKINNKETLQACLVVAKVSKLNLIRRAAYSAKNPLVLVLLHNPIPLRLVILSLLEVYSVTKVLEVDFWID